MQLPEDWQINIADLANRSLDGRDATSAAVKALMAEGYVVRELVHNGKGLFEGYDYHLFERPEHAVEWLSVNGLSVNGKTVNGKTATSKVLSNSKNEEREDELNLERFAPPAPAESDNLKAEEVKRGMYAPPAEAAAPTHLVKTTGPDSNGVIEAEGITLAVITYDQYPKPKNSQELKESMRRYFVANPKEWKDGVLEQSHATNWTAEKIGDCMTAFCAHQEAEGNLKRTYGQYKGMLVKWFLSQPSFDRTKFMPGASSTQSNSPVPTNIRRL
jgi:hypothetical protein